MVDFYLLIFLKDALVYLGLCISIYAGLHFFLNNAMCFSVEGKGLAHLFPLITPLGILQVLWGLSTSSGLPEGVNADFCLCIPGT